MADQIPAGTVVQIDGKDATVLEHGDGVVHVEMDGEAVSVHPSQIDAPPAKKNESPDADPANAPDPADDDDSPIIKLMTAMLRKDGEVIADLKSRVEILEARAADIEAQLAPALVSPIPTPGLVLPAQETAASADSAQP